MNQPPETERIVAATVRYLDNPNCLFDGTRHGDCFRAARDAGQVLTRHGEQGFTTLMWSAATSTWVFRFVTRKEAVGIAKAAGQIPADFEGDTLFSEDLW